MKKARQKDRIEEGGQGRAESVGEGKKSRYREPV